MTENSDPAAQEDLGEERVDRGLKVAFGALAKVTSPSFLDRPASPGMETTGRPRERPASRFEVLGEERNGGHTSVIRARDRELDRDVSLEVLSERVEAASEALGGFVAEAQVVAQLQHPGILPVLGLGFLEDGRPFVARRIAEGETLADLLARGSRGRVRLLRVLEQVAHAVAYAHARGVAHGALDPSVVVRGAHGEVVVAGWDRATRTNGDRAPVERDVAALAAMLSAVAGDGAGDSILTGTPRSAREIARAMGAFLARTESRAREAELTVAREHARAARERARRTLERRRAEAARRSRRRTLAVAALVLIAVILGGGGMLRKQREDRRAVTRAEQEIAAALREAERYEAASRWDQARASARKALALARGSDAAAAEAVERIDHRARIAADDAAMLGAFREVEVCWRDPREYTEDYERVFRTHGLDVLLLDLDEATRSLLSRSRRDEILAALNEWLLSESRDWRKGKLLALLDRTDPDLWRGRLREARGVEELREVAATADISSLPGGMLYLLGRVLAYRGLADEAEGVMRETHRRHPSDRLIAQSVKEAVEREEGASCGSSRARRSAAAGAAAVAVAPEEPRHWLNLGTSLALLRDEEEAERAYRKALALDPGYEKARQNLASVRIRLGRTEEAEPEVRSTLERDRESAVAHFQLARILAARGDDEGALREYRAAIALEPTEIRYLEELARVHEARGERAEAKALKRRVASLAPESETGLLARATALALEGEFEAAAAICRRVIELDPERPQPHSQLAAYLRGAGRHAEAAEAAGRAVALDGRNTDYRHRLAHCLADSGDLEGAAREFREAVRLSRDPEDHGIRLCLAFALAVLGRLEEAGRVYEEAERVAGDSPVGLAARGLRLCGLGRFGEAIDPLRRALGDPGLENRSYALDILLFCFQRGGRNEEGIAFCREEIARPRRGSQQLSHVHVALGQLLLLAKRPEEAEKAYRRAVDLDPLSHDARSGLGWILVHLRRPDEAVEHLRRALEMEPSGRLVSSTAVAHLEGVTGSERRTAIRRGSRASVLVTFGDAHRFTGRFEEAMAAYREASRLDPEEIFTQAWFALALTCQKTDDHAGAIEAWRKTLDAHPEDPERWNSLAWMLAACPQEDLRRPDEAVRLAEKAVALTGGRVGAVWNTLGVARYRAGRFEAAVAALLQARRLQDMAVFAYDGFFLAMAYARLERPKEARDWYDRSVRAMESNATDDAELRCFRAEAEALLGIETEKGK